MRKISYQYFVMSLAPLALTGCFQSAIECDSTETTSRISSDFRSQLENKLPKGAMDFISDISVTEIVTLKADADAGLNSCEAKVTVHATGSEEYAYQNIHYTNQTVKGGTEKSRTIYEFVDTFSHIDKYVFDIIRKPYYQREAERVGLKTPEQFLAYRDANSAIANSTARRSEIIKKDTALTSELKALEPKVSSFISAFHSGKTTIQPNDFIDITPVTVNPQKSTKKQLISKYIEFDAAITNKSKITYDSITFYANIYLNGSKKPIREQLIAFARLNSGLKPGETRTVKISIGPEVGFGGELTETTAWKEANTTTIVLRPASIEDGNGKSTNFNPNRNHFGSLESEQIDSITWDSYKAALNALQNNKKLLNEIDGEIAEAKKTLAELKAS